MMHILEEAEEGGGFECRHNPNLRTPPCDVPYWQTPPFGYALN